MNQPIISSGRLLLRPFALADASAVQQLAGEYDIADTTMNIPHPYEDGVAEQWIAVHHEQYQAGTNVVFAIELQELNELVVGYGFKELHLNRISAGHLVRNPASGKVMRKIGMVHEGTARQDAIKWGEHEDISWYGLLKADRRLKLVGGQGTMAQASA